MMEPHAEDEAAEAKDWATRYLCEDVVQLQYMKQHHYHKLNPETGERFRYGVASGQTNPGSAKVIIHGRHG